MTNEDQAITVLSDDELDNVAGGRLPGQVLIPGTVIAHRVKAVDAANTRFEQFAKSLF